MAIIYTYISCEIYDERACYECIPDKLMDEITEFRILLEVFLDGEGTQRAQALRVLIH